MNNQAVFLLTRKIFKRYKQAAIRTAKSFFKQEKKLLFLFEGRTYYRKGMGKDLYEKEKVFRESIKSCDVLIREIAGVSILSNFEDVPAENNPEETILVFTMTSLHIALFDLWKSKGILPNAITGLSLGEVTGVYAAGGLTLKDAIKVTASFARISQLEKDEFAFFYLHTDLSKALAICEACPAFLSVIYEMGEMLVLAIYHKDTFAVVSDYLNTGGVSWKIPHKETSWPYHSTLLVKYKKDFEVFTKDIELRPLQCNYFSCTLGKMLPKNAVIDPGFWFDLTNKPVLSHTTLQQLKPMGFNYVLHICAHPFLKGQVVRSMNLKSRAVLLDSINKDEQESITFKRTYKQLKKIKFERSGLLNTDLLNDFRKNFNLSHAHIAENPYPYFRYLHTQGNIHFLPVYKAWLLLNYADIDHVFKQPELFSSTIHKSFDEYLLGADPPSHTLIRTLLQPLFSPQVFAKLAAFTTEKSHRLLDKLKDRHRFNMVDEFSLPLATAVVAKFLGLTSTEEETLNNSLQGHLYSMAYLPQLEEFCKNYLEENQDSKKENIATLLLSFVRDERLPFKGAVSLMKMLWIAGVTTTSMLLSSAIYLLAKDEALLKQLQLNEQLINKFIEECLRLEAPESELRRITMQETNISGKTLPAGSIVMLGLRAVNRDPEYFENPDEISFNRTAKRHFSFGGGYHYCLGVGIARAEARYAIKAILESMPEFCLVAGEAVSYFPSPHFRGLSRLVITEKNKI